MKNTSFSVLSIIIIAIVGFCGLVSADITYKASMSGIDCDGCKKTIVASLGKIDGVKQIRVAKLKKKGMHQLTVVTDGAPISREQAVAAISNAEHYKIVSWEAK